MSDRCRLIWWALVARLRSRAAIEAENMVLRQQINDHRRWTIALGAAAVATSIAPAAAQTQGPMYGPKDGKEVAPGVRQVDLGKGPATIPGYTTVSMRDIVSDLPFLAIDPVSISPARSAWRRSDRGMWRDGWGSPGFHIPQTGADPSSPHHPRERRFFFAAASPRLACVAPQDCHGSGAMPYRAGSIVILAQLFGRRTRRAAGRARHFTFVLAL